MNERIWGEHDRLDLGRIRDAATDVHEDCGCDQPGCWATCIHTEAGEILTLIKAVEGLKWIAEGRTGGFGSAREFACHLVSCFDFGDGLAKSARDRELGRLREIEWLARDFIWSYPDTIDHPTYVALANAFDNAKKP